MLPVCLLGVACGSDGGSAGGTTDDVLSQAPHCPTGTDALKIEGTINGAVIDDARTTNINAFYQNIGMAKFVTPTSDLVPLAGNQLTLTINWGSSLFNGQTGAITSGSLALPASSPQPGAKFCISAGKLGFVDGGTEDGALKFAISEVKGADCSGSATAVDLRGCYQ